MKVLHTGTFDVNAGGPAMSTYLTLHALRQWGIDAELFMFPLSKGGVLRGDKVPVHYASAPIDSKLCYSFSYKKEMLALGEYDIYHAQGLWQYPTYALADVARQRGKPYIITPRGMLYAQDIEKSNKIFKRLSLKLRLLRDLNRAACVHVTCEDEMLHCRNLGVTAPICIIPNPIEIQEYTEHKKDNTFRIGYLGRLSPRKNVESLIYAFSQLKEIATSSELLIIGGGDREYEKFLRREVQRLGLKNVKFTGFLSGNAKAEAIASVSVMAMPSEFENLGNVVLESLVRRIPCIATTGSPWRELYTHKCGWWVEYTQEAITNAIKEAISTPRETLAQMGERGRALMECNYSTESVARRMMELYLSIKK
ncbi:MAG: glycosyltransferase [Rikenellaceae bacterium]